MKLFWLVTSSRFESRAAGAEGTSSLSSLMSPVLTEVALCDSDGTECAPASGPSSMFWGCEEGLLLLP